MITFSGFILSSSRGFVVYLYLFILVNKPATRYLIKILLFCSVIYITYIYQFYLLTYIYTLTEAKSLLQRGLI